MREHFGGIGDGVARGLRLRHDHGSNDRADDFQQEVAFFGIDSAPSFVREPEPGLFVREPISVPSRCDRIANEGSGVAAVGCRSRLTGRW